MAQTNSQKETPTQLRRRGRPFDHFEQSELTREQAIYAAQEIVRKDGLEALTIIQLAEELRVSRAPIYKLFKSRQTLVDAVVDAILLQILDDLPDDSTDWREALEAQALISFKTFLEYPGFASEMVRTGFPDREAGKLSSYRIAKTLLAAGCEEDKIPAFILAVISLITGAAPIFRGQQERYSEAEKSPQDKERFSARLGDTLPKQLMDFDTFRLALDVLLSGIENHVTRNPDD